jgi:hypothetical protein
VVHTDRHLSYPSAVRAINGVHIIVNHSSGFTNSEGFHKNEIENLWSLLKFEIGKRKGVNRSFFVFLKEFSGDTNI